jgi:hypothetical protein
MRSIVCLSVLLLAPLSDALAQTPLPLQFSERVRVTASEFSLTEQEAELVGIGNDVVVAVADSTLRLPVASLERFEVHAGRQGHVWRGVGIGFLAGAVSGAALGATANCASSESCSPFESTGQVVAAGAVIVGLGGAVVGGIVGAFIKTDKWEEVPLDNLRVSIVPQREGRFALAASVRF